MQGCSKYAIWSMGELFSCSSVDKTIVFESQNIPVQAVLVIISLLNYSVITIFRMT